MKREPLLVDKFLALDYDTANAMVTRPFWEFGEDKQPDPFAPPTRAKKK